MTYPGPTSQEAGRAPRPGWAVALAGQCPPLSRTARTLFQKAFSFPDVEGLYLLTDGKPDTSCSLVLREVQRLGEGRAVRVHTIALARSDR